MDAALVIDKPEGMTSHDVVDRVRRILKERSIGHLGTLDPMATGVLPLLVGRYTRLAQFFDKADKTYEGEIRLGFSTDTYDATGEQTGEPKPVNVSLEQAAEAAKRFWERPTRYRRRFPRRRSPACRTTSWRAKVSRQS